MDTLLVGAQALQLEKIVQQPEGIALYVSSKQSVVTCSTCQAESNKPHSRYYRTVADLPWAGVAVRLHLRVRKFFCLNSKCGQRIFCERLPEVVPHYARRTDRLKDALSQIGFALGGRPGARTANILGMRTGADSILRRIRHAATTQGSGEPKVRMLGVDDWALRKGQHYGTILVDLEKRQPIDLLPGREALPLEQWLKRHPEVEVITRDRAGAYADGARKGAPQARQVADRWHLLKNGNEAFEKVIKRHRKTIREAVDQLPPRSEAVPAAEPVSPSVVASTASEYVRSRTEKERRQFFHSERKGRYDQVQDLKRQGFTIIQIKNHLGCGYSAVANFFRADEYPVINRRKGRSCLDEFDAYLRERWEAGCHNAGELYQELCRKGYTGSDVTVRRHVQLWRQQEVKTLPPATRKWSVPGPQSCLWMLLKGEQKLDVEERLLRETILNASPAIKQGLELIESFRKAMSSRSEKKLEDWMEEAAKSQLPEFKNFVVGLRKDERAVCAAASSEWSNGQTEGQVNRLKI